MDAIAVKTPDGKVIGGVHIEEDHRHVYITLNPSYYNSGYHITEIHVQPNNVYICLDAND